MNNYLLPIPTPAQIDWWALMPVIVVSVGGIIALLVEMFHRERHNGAIIWTCMITLALGAFTVLYQLGAPAGETLNGQVFRDRIGLIFQLVLIGVGFLTVAFSEDYLREKRIPFGEFYPLVLWSTAGAMIMVSTKSLLMIFIGLEVLSIALYVLAGLAKDEQKSEESAIKYFLLGAFGSAFLLYGIAFLYGASGSIHLDQILLASQSDNAMVRTMTIFGTALLLVGLCFKASFVPFHQWTPDVYQGAPTNVTAFMASSAKIGAIAALIRVVDGTQGIRETYMPFLYAVALATMLFGNIVALRQTDVKRMLGYSSIGNAGYLLVALLAYMQNPARIGPDAMTYFLIGYAATTLGIFATFSLVARAGHEETRFEDLHGLWRREPFAAVAMVILGISLIGLPPSAGFFAKMFIFFDSIEVGMAPLAITMAVASVISMAYYLKLIKAAFVDSAAHDQRVMAPMKAGLKFVAGACCFVTIALIAAQGPLSNYLNQQTVPVAKLESR